MYRRAISTNFNANNKYSTWKDKLQFWKKQRDSAYTMVSKVDGKTSYKLNSILQLLPEADPDELRKYLIMFDGDKDRAIKHYMNNKMRKNNQNKQRNRIFDKNWFFKIKSKLF